MKETTPSERIRKAATENRRSTLYLWMFANFEEFEATVADAGRPNWGALAKAFAEEGLVGLRNQPPTAEGARLTWFKVRQAKQGKRSAVPRSGMSASREASEPEDDDDDAFFRPITKLSR